jgi:aconitate hydratase 2/2-methylisocitrate dehydratase
MTIQQAAQEALSQITLVYDAFNDVWELAPKNPYAQGVIEAWATATWFTRKPAVPEVVTVRVFKVPGEINTDDLSPAVHATTRPDIPLHALSMLETRAPGAIATIRELQGLGLPVAFVGDVVGTGSSRKSAINSLLWHIGEDIPGVPNKRRGGVILGGTIAPIFFNTAEDAGALPIECDVTGLTTGQVIRIYPYRGELRDEQDHVITHIYP